LKRKRQPSSHNGPTPKKPKHLVQQRPRKRTRISKLYQHSPKCWNLTRLHTTTVFYNCIQPVYIDQNLYLSASPRISKPVLEASITPYCHSVRVLGTISNTKQHICLHHSSRGTAISSATDQLPSPASSVSGHINLEMAYDYSSLSESSGDLLPILTEITFRPRSLCCYSFVVVIRDGGKGFSFSQFTQLIKDIGHIG